MKRIDEVIFARIEFDFPLFAAIYFDKKRTKSRFMVRLAHGITTFVSNATAAL